MLAKALQHKRKPSASTSWIEKAATLATIASMSLVGSILAICNNAIASQAPASQAPTNQATDVAKEIKLSNEVIVYNNEEDIKILFDLIAKYSTL